MMVKSGQRSGIPVVGFAPAIGTSSGIEVLTLARLHDRSHPEQLMRPQRPTFHQLIGLRTGTLKHATDFRSHHLEPGCWLWARPGQVQQWSPLGAADGLVVMFEPRVVDPGTQRLAGLDDPAAPVVLSPGPAEAHTLSSLALLLRREFRTPTGTRPVAVHLSAMGHALGLLLLHLSTVAARDDSRVDPVTHTTFVRLHAAVEQRFATTRNVADYARELGYAPRTLSRATQQAVGLAAKDFIDRRVVLEAQRLLAHTDHPASRIADDLGFSSATNFTKFFRRHTGRTPLRFREQVRVED